MTEAEVQKSSRRLPMWWLWIGLSVLTMMLSAWIRVSNIGWLLIVGGVILCGMMVAHPVVHAVAALRGGGHRIVIPMLLLLSNLLFLLGFGLQADSSDMPGSTVAFQAFYHIVLRGENAAPVVSDDWANALTGGALWLLGALIVTWILLLVVVLRRPKAKPAG